VTLAPIIIEDVSILDLLHGKCVALVLFIKLEEAELQVQKSRKKEVAR
jgi:hypothetical protein